MTVLEQFCTVFGVWDVVLPYLPLIVTDEEMRLVVAMDGQSPTADEVAARLGVGGEAAGELLARAYSRCVVNREVQDGATRYTAADLYARLDHFAKFENWDDIPAEDRRIIDRRFLDEFIALHRTTIEKKMAGMDVRAPLSSLAVLLLDEVMDMLDVAHEFALQPCDCRRLGQYCGRPVETCLAMDAAARDLLDRGHGRPLTRDEAKKLVRRADRKGLMHTANGDWRARGPTVLCNCCACDCYPFRTAQELGSKGVWPKSRYVAVYDREECRLCGTCVERCHFHAFYHDGTRVPGTGHPEGSANVVFDPARCWGCGLCANTCATGAIRMEPCP